MERSKPDWQKVKPLGEITCSFHDCEHDLHCFRRWRPSVGQSYRNRHCIDCGVDLIDWNRIDKKNLGDVNYTIQAIQYEGFRHIYWHKNIDERAMALARKKGLQQLRIDARKRIERYVRPPSRELFRDGTQTPFEGNLIYYAQHGTATCCRKCAEEWHGIERNRSLTQEEIKYMVDLVMLYIKKRVPDLTE